jgi:hypothetical protein
VGFFADRVIRSPTAVFDLQVYDTYNAIPNLKCDMPDTFATISGTVSVRVPLLERNDSHLFYSWVRSSLPMLFLGPSGSGKSTAFLTALNHQPLPCIYLSFREKKTSFESLMRPLSVRKGFDVC